jgi:tetratricopeptide (TPR) repeat protein
MDLGVARHTERTTALTQEGQFAGSLLYAAPEQLRGNEVGPAADLYALGVVLYELLSGVNPFRHDDPSAVIAAHLESEPERLDRRMSDVTLFLSELVGTLLAKRPAERLADATLLRDVLTKGERSAWWSARERRILRERGRRPQVPVRRETRVYGRETELTFCREAWEQAKDGRGNVLLLEGEAGIGKSRLVDALVSELDGADAHVLYGSYPPSGGMGGFSDAILTQFGRADLAESLKPYLTVTPTLVPAFTALVRREAPPEGAASLQGDALHAVCVHFMRALAEEKSLLWVVEDLHFADRDSRMLLLSLARAVEGHPILLLATTRPGIPEDELAHFGRLDNFRRATLERLSAREVVLLLQDAFRSEMLADKLGARIALKSDGVPFFVFEMIRGLKEGKFITQLPDGSWVESKAIEKIEVPPAVKDLIEARLRGLPRDDRAILDIGSVLGFEFDPDLIIEVLERTRVALLQDLAEIERRSGVVCVSGRRYRFDHHQIQEVVYSSLSEGLREEYHTLLAQAFAGRVGGEPSGEDHAFLASHHLRGSRPRDGLPHLEPALEYLGKGYRNDTLLDLARCALEAEGVLEGRERVKVLLRQVDWLGLLGRREEQRAALDEALTLVDETGSEALLAKVQVSLGSYLVEMSQYDAAQAALEEALELAQAAGDKKLEGHATGNLGLVFCRLGRHAEAREHHERARALCHEIGDRRGEAATAGNLGLVFWNLGLVFWNLGRYAEAQVHHEHSRALCREIGERKGEAAATGNLGSVFENLGRYAEAQEHDERHRALCREIGYRRGEASATLNLGSVFFNLGRYAEAQEHAERSRALFREIGERAGEAVTTLNLGIVFFNLGRYAEAQENYERFRALVREIGDRQGEGVALVELGPLQALLGQTDDARATLEASLRVLREVGARRPEGYGLHWLGELHAQIGDRNTARRFLEDALALRREISYPSGIATTLISLGRLEAETGNVDAASSLLDEARTLARETNLPGTILAATVEQARLRGGDVQAARAALAEHEERAGHSERVNARFRLWQLSQDMADLVEAHRLLCFARDHAPEDCRTSMIENVPLHRDIMKAWAKHGENG